MGIARVTPPQGSVVRAESVRPLHGRALAMWASLALACGLVGGTSWAQEAAPEGSTSATTIRQKTAGSAVEIIRQNDGHLGAGVQIEPGLILTAAHVVADQAKVLVRDDQGRELVGEVETAIAGVDLAFVTVRTPSNMKVSQLSCRVPPIGTPIEMVGHPFGREFVLMSGAVAEGLQSVGTWPSLVILNKNAFSGMSGGPVMTRDGFVVGIVVAATSPQPRLVSPAGVVPGSVICANLPANHPLSLLKDAQPPHG